MIARCMPVPSVVTDCESGRAQTTSVPLECKQAGGCAVAEDMNSGMSRFETAGGTQEVLDAKNGRYSTGLKVQDIAAGDEDGPEIGANSFVQCHYVLRRANGYFVDASYGFDRFDTYDFKMGKGQVIPGFEQVSTARGGQSMSGVPAPASLTPPPSIMEQGAQGTHPVPDSSELSRLLWACTRARDVASWCLRS